MNFDTQQGMKHVTFKVYAVFSTMPFCSLRIFSMHILEYSYRIFVPMLKRLAVGKNRSIRYSSASKT